MRMQRRLGRCFYGYDRTGLAIWGKARTELAAGWQKISGFGGIGCRCRGHRSIGSRLPGCLGAVSW